jgi:cytoskeleton protein RodZ
MSKSDFPVENDSPVQEAGNEPLPTDALAKRRVELGLTYDDIANQLKFAPRQIEALEAGEFDRLPGGTFARGMVRTYSRLLKLDPAPILEQMAAAGIGAQGGLEKAVSLRAPIPFSEGGRHTNVVYAVMSVVILFVVAFYAIDLWQQKTGTGDLAFVNPAGTARPGAEVKPSTETPPQETVVERPAASATLASAGPTPLPETSQRVEDKAPPASIPVAPGKSRIVLRFDKESWVEIKGRNGTLLSQINAAGSEKVVDGDPPFQLTIGNAPSVHMTYNDQPVDLKPHYKVDVARFTLK